MKFKVVSSSKIHEDYLYLAIEDADLPVNVWNKLLQRINEECRQCGYEKIMIDLSKLSAPVSVATLYRAASSPIAINLLPFRLAWVNHDEAWNNNWKSLEMVMRNRSLPWRSFSDREAAEIWLTQDRRTSLLQIKQTSPGHTCPAN